MTKKLVSAVSNDNCATRWRFNDTKRSKDAYRLLQYVPIARSLIQRYCRHSWKHTPADNNYTFLEYQLCTLLKNGSADSVPCERIGIIAKALEISAIVLCNDPSLKHSSSPSAIF